jgi:hypothetical protein
MVEVVVGRPREILGCRRPHRKHDRRHIIISATIAGTNADNSTASNSIIFVGVYESFSTNFSHHRVGEILILVQEYFLLHSQQRQCLPT